MLPSSHQQVRGGLMRAGNVGLSGWRPEARPSRLAVRRTG